MRKVQHNNTMKTDKMDNAVMGVIGFVSLIFLYFIYTFFACMFPKQDRPKTLSNKTD